MSSPSTITNIKNVVQSTQQQVHLAGVTNTNSNSISTNSINTITITNSTDHTNIHYVLELKPVTITNIQDTNNYNMCNTYFKANKQTIYTKINKFNSQKTQPIFFDLKEGQNMNKINITQKHKKEIEQLYNDIDKGGIYLYALNAYKSIVVNKNTDESDVDKQINYENTSKLTKTNNHTLKEYLFIILKDIHRNIIIIEDKFFMINFKEDLELLYYYKNNLHMFLKHFGNFLSKQFNKDKHSQYSINFTHDQIKNIKCSNCIDLNNQNYNNLNCTLFSDIKIEDNDTNTTNTNITSELENLKNLKKLLYNIIIFFQAYNIIIINSLVHYYDINPIRLPNILKLKYNVQNNCIFFDTYEQKNIIIRIYKIDYEIDYSYDIKKNVTIIKHAGYMCCVFYIDEYEIEKNAYVYLDIKSKDTIIKEIEKQDRENKEQNYNKFISTVVRHSGHRGGMRSKTNINKKTYRINNKLIHKVQHYKSKYNKNIKHNSKKKTKKY